MDGMAEEAYQFMPWERYPCSHAAEASAQLEVNKLPRKSFSAISKARGPLPLSH
jgi:hypothetical protein